MPKPDDVLPLKLVEAEEYHAYDARVAAMDAERKAADAQEVALVAQKLIDKATLTPSGELHASSSWDAVSPRHLNDLVARLKETGWDTETDERIVTKRARTTGRRVGRLYRATEVKIEIHGIPKSAFSESADGIRTPSQVLQDIQPGQPALKPGA